MKDEKEQRSVWSRLTHRLFHKRHMMSEKVCQLEKQVQELKELYGDERYRMDSPIVIEQLHIDNIAVDRLDLNNNIGTMGIKELSGKLNIGANYGGGPPAEEMTSATPFPGMPKRKKEDAPSSSQVPKYNIRPKKD